MACASTISATRSPASDGCGLSLSLVGGLLGHKNQSTTAGYTHLWDDPLREAAHKVGARIASAFDGPARESADVVHLRKSK